jgi:hypothetical protein
MQLVASRYARRKQRQVPTTGHLFERRYRAKLVMSDRYLLALVRYIHLNPVRAGLTADPSAYRWSSHRAYLGLAGPGPLAIEPALDTLAKDRVMAVGAYREFMQNQPAPDELPHIHPAARGLATPPDVARAPVKCPPPRGLEAIVMEVARESGIDVAAIRSASRLPVLVQARADIARRALREGVATLSQVALRLGRAPSTLSELLQKPGTPR